MAYDKGTTEGDGTGLVEIMAVGLDCVPMVTLDGHPEAGVLDFRSTADGSLGFVIESGARSGDHALRFRYDIGIAQPLQAEMGSRYVWPSPGWSTACSGVRSTC